MIKESRVATYNRSIAPPKLFKSTQNLTTREQLTSSRAPIFLTTGPVHSTVMLPRLTPSASYFQLTTTEDANSSWLPLSF